MTHIPVIDKSNFGLLDAHLNKLKKNEKINSFYNVEPKQVRHVKPVAVKKNDPIFPEVNKIEALDPAEVIAKPKAASVQAPLPKKTLWTWLKGVFSAIAEFFRSIFGSGDQPLTDDEQTTPDSLKDELNDLSQKNSVDPKEWNALIDQLKENEEKHVEKFWKKIEEINEKNKPNCAKQLKNQGKKLGLDKYKKLEGEIKFALMKIIENKPEAKETLEECLERLGEVDGIKAPAPLKNNKNSCYMDALLQVLFASKAFIEILKNTKTEENTYKQVVSTLKNYCLGLEVGLQKDEINKLRDEFRTAVKKLPKGQGLDKHGGVTGQQDATELLDILFEALKVEQNYLFKTNLKKVYDLANYEIKDENPQDLALRVKIPPVPERDLSDEQKEEVKDIQAFYDAFITKFNEFQDKYGLEKKREPIEFKQDLKDDINSKEAPKVTLQEVVDAYFAEEKGESDEPLESAMEKFLMDGGDPTLLDDAEVKATAKKFKEATTLSGDVPPFLVLVVGRENPATRRLNSRKIEIPADEIVHITIDDQPIAYRLVGIAGGNIGTGGGHWVANAKVNNKWHFVDDTASKAVPLKSANDRLNTSGRFYVLEKVEE